MDPVLVDQLDPKQIEALFAFKQIIADLQYRFTLILVGLILIVVGVLLSQTPKGALQGIPLAVIGFFLLLRAFQI